MIGDFDVECVTPSDDPDAGTNTLVFKYAAPKGTGIVEVVVKRRLSGWNTLLEVYVDGLLPGELLHAVELCWPAGETTVVGATVVIQGSGERVDCVALDCDDESPRLNRRCDCGEQNDCDRDESCRPRHVCREGLCVGEFEG